MALSDAQQQTVDGWFPGAVVVADLSWGLVDTVVLHLRHDGGEAVVKAAGPSDGHLPREIAAHERWTGPWRTTGRIGRLLHADRDQNVFALSYLPGVLVQDSPAADDADTYRQAGALLAAYHAQAARVSQSYEAQMDARAITWLDGEHRISQGIVTRLREVIASHDQPAVELVPTHGDWQTRNWLVNDDGQILVIDLGRADWRPALTDFARLARREWEGRPGLERAFIEGYRGDPRESAAWQRTLLREAIGTACWAYQVGAEDFEQEGHRMIRQALAAA
ncbi:phosphotransferase [Leekyejoonella antrihumi]|uniref:Aminoglycoside phosphotransferase family protein n=1 Tax=Leekyejoonella antrihumi TaxID=1660198 RepID=A0A563DUT7_9MICO|nr:phosphotransferase [Leekyejoonella antrihumi]TWP33946.1 aminoglycoside phosphotransferase family protein [Leekyejoonella antrihumi]